MSTGRLMRRRAVCVAASAALALAMHTALAVDAVADRGGPADPNTGQDADSGNGSIGSSVKFSLANNGSGTTMTASNPSWTPPVCWFEPKYTNDRLVKQNEKWAEEGPLYGIDEETHENRKKVTDAHKGKKGMWYERTPQLSPRSCTIGELWIWVDPQQPPPSEDVIDPEILAGLAYERTELPAPPVKLRPAPDNQIVNLDTLVEFADPLERVWVTARLDNAAADLHIAATTVATPSKLRIDAGTKYADPRTCEYELVRAGAGYKVDSSGADCNITYRKSSGDGTYTLRSEIVWDVHWTATADPDGAPEQPDLPDGLSTHEEDVTVKEIQSVNR